MELFNLKNMRKSFLILSISLSADLFAQVQDPFTSQVQQANAKTVILKNLNYKTVFMQFHQKDIRFLKMKEIYMDQSVGLKDPQGNIEYAVFNPIVSYKNLQGEQRFMVHIERFSQENGELNTGHPARPIVELYLFKRLSNGDYQLLSRTHPELDISGSWGESHLSSHDLMGIKQVGTQQQGVFYSGGYTSTGSSTEMTFLIVLNESGWIEQYPFGRTEDNSGAYERKDPQYGGYSKVYNLIKNPEVQGLYPIQIQYAKEGKMDWIQDFPKNGFKEIVKFNLKKNCFVHANGQCNTDFDDE